jgi:hypothetical protein
MTDESEAELIAIDPDALRGMAAVVGINLAGDRATTLAPQAEQHFAQFRELNSIADASTEPAAELRLDRWTKPGSD